MKKTVRERKMRPKSLMIGIFTMLLGVVSFSFIGHRLVQPAMGVSHYFVQNEQGTRWLYSANAKGGYDVFNSDSDKVAQITTSLVQHP